MTAPEPLEGQAADGLRPTLATMRARHLDAVVAIEEQVHDRPWSRKLFEGEISRADRHYRVARIGDEVVGYAGLLVMLDEGHVGTVSTAPGHQGRGIATRLLIDLVRTALEVGLDRLTLEVRVSNERAHVLYRRFGFAPAGVRRGYYGDGEDAVVMWVHDIDSEDYAARLERIEASLGDPIRRRAGAGAGRSGRVADPSGHPAGHPAGRAAGHPAAASAGGATRMER